MDTLDVIVLAAIGAAMVAAVVFGFDDPDAPVASRLFGLVLGGATLLMYGGCRYWYLHMLH